MLYIGIDLGTSAVKLLLADEKGTVLKIVFREYPLFFPNPGWSEQNPEDWYQGTIDGLRELIADVDKTHIAGISFGGQMHGLVILDQEDRVIRPAILWNDGRTKQESDYLNETVGKKQLTQYTANISFAGFTASKLLWLRRVEPENFAKIKKIMLPKDYLCYRLTGVFSTDTSDASGTLFLDVQNRRWSPEMCEICGILPEQLPVVYESYEKVGMLKESVARELGLPSSVVVAAGAGDNAAAAVGTGTVGEGRCNISLGTSGTIFVSSDTFCVDENNALHSFDHADGHYHLMGCMLSAASCNEWWTKGILQMPDYSALQSMIQNLGNNHVFFLPYLMGERSPWNDPCARGTFIGITMDTTRADMTQAVLEGVAFAMRDMFEVAKSLGVMPARSMICGGGAKSPLWRKIIANTLNLPLDIPACEEGPSMGAAMLAMVANGEYASVEDAVKHLVKVELTEEPDLELVQKYDEKYQQFKLLYPALKDVFSRIV